MRDARFWVRKPTPTGEALFVAVVALFALFCYTSLDGALHELATGTFRSSRNIAHALAMLSFGWIGGLFVVLFVDGECTRMMTPFNYRSTCVVVGSGLILTGIAAGAWLVTKF